MKMEDYIKLYKQAKRNQKYISAIAAELTVYYFAHSNKKIIEKNIECRYCKSTATKKVTINFQKPQKLTVFHAALIYSLFIENQIPVDYANWHKCQAGKEFIENIKEVETK